MSETLLSVGIDIGTSTTQLILSRLTLANRANPFSVPRIAIEDREVLYRSGIHFTPLLSDTVIDAEGVRTIVAEEYRKSGFAPEQVDTGAVIITGETARKENAREVLSALSQFAGVFVVATAGPDLESILAARGAGADEYSREHHTDVLHFDIGGGTSNLALYSHGELAATGCLDVGGRLIKLDREGTVTYVSPVLKRGAMWASPPTVGQKAAPEGLEPVIRSMVEALEQAAGLRPGRDRLDAFLTQGTRWEPRAVPVVSFSGGVADCIYAPPGDWKAYGDIGVLLGRAIAASPAFQGAGRFRGEEPLHRAVRLHHLLPGHRLPPEEPAHPQADWRGGAGGRRRPGTVHPGQAGVVCRRGRAEPACPGPAGGGKPLLRPGGRAGPRDCRGAGAPARPRDRPRGAGGGRPGQGAGSGHGPEGGGPPPLPGQRGGGQGRLYRHRRARGGRRCITSCHQDAGIQQIVTAKERSHDTQNKVAGARVRV